MARTLITSEYFPCWDNNKKAIFLGEWCKKNINKSLLSSMDYVVANPFGVKKGDYKSLLCETNAIYDNFLPELSNMLNKIHAVNYSKRYWEIIIGHWLKAYISIMLNRYKSLLKAIGENEIDGVYLTPTSDYGLVTEDYSDFHVKSDDSRWNSALYTKILDEIEVGFKNNIVEFLDTDFFSTKEDKDFRKPKIKSMKDHFIKFFFSRITPFFSKKDDAFIVNSYIVPKFDFLLQVSLWQIPQLWNFHEKSVRFDGVNQNIRKHFQFDLKEKKGLDFIIRKLLKFFIPFVYVEGYKKINIKADSLKWPKNPKFIFTSNSFLHDEVFKFWTAKKVHDGVPYYVGQHGSDYGTRIDSLDYVEFKTCDKFLSWGWKFYKNESKVKIKPMFNFKVVEKKINYDISGGLLIIQRSRGSRYTPQDNYYEHILYQRKLFKLVRGLLNNIKSKVVVRLHKRVKSLGSDDAELWSNFLGKSSVDVQKESLTNLISKSRLSLFTYDSTGVLELLNLNVPIIGYWDSGHYSEDNLISSAKPYYDNLKKANILFYDVDEAIDFINKNWSSIDEWWHSEGVQNARKIFLDQYSANTQTPVKLLRSALG
jgi:putative transferase (TIGR04331 family)